MYTYNFDYDAVAINLQNGGVKLVISGAKMRMHIKIKYTVVGIGGKMGRICRAVLHASQSAFHFVLDRSD